MKALVLLVFFAFAGTLPDTDRIIWSPERPLKWSDFQGPKELGSKHWAATNSGIRYEYGYSTSNNNRKLEFEVTAFMTPKKSWSIREKRNADLLRHEQLHFDITELHARKLRRAFHKYAFTDDFKSEVSHIYKTLIKASQDMQDRYDEETNHSQNKEIQAEWEDKIARGLERMADWTEHKVENSR